MMLDSITLLPSIHPAAPPPSRHDSLVALSSPAGAAFPAIARDPRGGAPLRRRAFGRTGLGVSELCLGTLNFGWRVGEAQAFALLDAFYAAGGNFIQATAVGGADERALTVTEASETYVGRWWRSRAIKRDDLFLATRIVIGVPRPQGAVAMETLIRGCIERSLQRMRVRYLDLVLIEWRDDLPPVDDILLGLGKAKRAGWVRYFGAAGFPAWRLMESVHRAMVRGWDRFEVVQADYSLLARGAGEAELLRLCRDYRAGFLARSPLGGGVLVGKTTAPRDRVNAAEAASMGERLAVVARRLGAAVPQVALAWTLRQLVLTAPVVSVGSVGHLRDLLAAPHLNLTEGDFAFLETTAVPANRVSAAKLNRKPILT